jgi:hypothetical protein
MRLLVTAALALVPALALAQEVSPLETEGQRSVGFPSSSGLCGMRDLIDARVPQSIVNLRSMLRFDNESENLSSSSGKYSLDSYTMSLVLGASAFNILDAGFALPTEIRSVKNDVNGTGGHDTNNGVGDIQVAAKGGFKLGSWISLGPYGLVHVNSGSKSLEKTNFLETGSAVTVSFLDERIALVGNLGSVNYNGGKWSVAYRGGPSFVVLANDNVLLRAFSYVDGNYWIGSKERGNDLRLFFGAQANIFKLITAEVSFGWRLDSRNLPDGVKDTATYGLDVGAGASFSF